MALTIEKAIKKKKKYKEYMVLFKNKNTLFIKRGYDAREFTTEVKDPDHARLECINQARDYINQKHFNRTKEMYEHQMLFIWLTICCRDESLYFVDQLEKEEKQDLNRFMAAAKTFTESLEKTLEKPENAEIEDSSELIMAYIRKTMLTAKRALFAGKGDDFEVFLDKFAMGKYKIQKG